MLARVSYIFRIATVLALSGCSGNEPETQKQPDFPQVQATPVDRGAVLYSEKCEACHGADGTAGIAGAANLKVSRVDSAIVSLQIANGKNAMPAFKGQLSADETSKIAHYVLGLRK
jgi:mono/diheme cytochrome c family protein